MFKLKLVRLDVVLERSGLLLDPLRQIIDAMHAAGLKPSILSGYRSYDVQYLAWKWWNSQYPERVAIMSARAGYSEHQLGTTVDFGSPEIDHLFHVDFANTQEGLWLRICGFGALAAVLVATVQALEQPHRRETAEALLAASRAILRRQSTP